MGGHPFHPDPIRLSSVQFQNPDVRARPAITLRSNLLVPIGSEKPETPIHRDASPGLGVEVIEVYRGAMVSKAPDSGGETVCFDAEDLSIVRLGYVLCVVPKAGHANRSAVFGIHVAPGKMPLRSPIVWRGKRVDELTGLGQLVQRSFQNVHGIDGARSIDPGVISHDSISCTQEGSMCGAGGNVQTSHLPKIRTKVNNHDADIIAAAGDIGVMNQPAGRRGGGARRSPLAANPAGLGVIPAASEVLIVNDDEHVLVKLRSALGTRNASMSRREGHIVITYRGCAQCRFSSTGSGVKHRSGDSSRKTITADGERICTLRAVDQIGIHEAKRASRPQRHYQSTSRMCSRKRTDGH